MPSQQRDLRRKSLLLLPATMLNKKIDLASLFVLLLVEGGLSQTLCLVDNTETCPKENLDDNGANFVYPGGNTRCGFDMVDGEENPYYFQVQKGRNGKEDHVLIHFAEGGACFDYNGCLSDDGTVKVPGSVTTGILDRDNNDNPFRDWAIAVVLYCTGDLHSGNGVDNGPNAVDEYHFNGRANAKAVLDWVQTNYGNPEKVLVTGSSAGSLGAQFWSKYIVDIAQEKVSFVFDGFVFVTWTGSSELTKTFVETWDVCSTEFGLSNDQVNDCMAGNLDFDVFPKNGIATRNDVPFGYVTYKQDQIQIDQLCDGMELKQCDQPEAYGMIVDWLEDIIMVVGDDNVISYVLNGDGHTTLASSNLYDSDNGEGEPSLLQWVDGIVNHADDMFTIPSSCVPGEMNFKNKKFDYSCSETLTDATFGSGEILPDRW